MLQMITGDAGLTGSPKRGELNNHLNNSNDHSIPSPAPDTGSNHPNHPNTPHKESSRDDAKPQNISGSTSRLSQREEEKDDVAAEVSVSIVSDHSNPFLNSPHTTPLIVS